MKRGHQLTGVHIALVTTLLTGCDELGRDARGERKVTALQSIARDRQCIPLADLAQTRLSRDHAALEFLLRDGSRWQNTPVNTACLPQSSHDTDSSVAVTTTFNVHATEACTSDTVWVQARAKSDAAPATVLATDPEPCILQRFSRL